MTQNLDNFLEKIHNCATEEEQQVLLSQERTRIFGLDNRDSMSELDAIAKRTKEIRASVETLKKEKQLRTAIVQILNETTDVAILENYRQVLLTLIKKQEPSVTG